MNFFDLVHPTKQQVKPPVGEVKKRGAGDQDQNQEKARCLLIDVVTGNKR